MTTSAEHEWQEWVDTWQADSGPLAPPEAIRQYVRRRSRLLAVWVTGEVIVALGFSSFLVHRTLTDPDPAERLAMGLLALIAAAALVASWWTWRGAIRSSGLSTAAFVALAIERSRRVRRAIGVGWGILVAELAVFVPWVWHGLYGGADAPSRDAERFGWGLLVGLTTLAVLFLGSLHAWARADRVRIENLRREIENS